MFKTRSWNSYTGYTQHISARSQTQDERLYWDHMGPCAKSYQALTKEALTIAASELLIIGWAVAKLLIMRSSTPGLHMGWYEMSDYGAISRVGVSQSCNGWPKANFAPGERR